MRARLCCWFTEDNKAGRGSEERRGGKSDRKGSERVIIRPRKIKQRASARVRSDLFASIYEMK